MESSYGINDLPDEILVRILSYLNTKDRLCAGKACWKYYRAYKHPSLWKRVEIKIHSHQKLISFCDFFTKYNYIRKLSMKVDKGFRFLDSDISAINKLFANLNQLWCLKVSEMDIASISLPTNVRYVNLMTVSSLIFDPIEQYNSISKCPNIESIFIVFFWRGAELFNQMMMPRFVEAGKSLLRKYESSLKSLYMRPFHDQWLSFIGNCLNIRELTLLFGNFEKPVLRQEDMVAIAKLPKLESLVMDYDFLNKFSLVLKKYGLPDLKNLSIMDCLSMNGKDFDLILDKVPRLTTFCLNGTMDVRGLYKFIANCYTLQYFCFGGDCICVDDRIYIIDKIYHLSQQRSFANICFCELIYTYTLVDKIDYITWHTQKFGRPLFSCKKCYSNTRVSLRCNCWPEERFNYAERFYALYNSYDLKKFPELNTHGCDCSYCISCSNRSNINCSGSSDSSSDSD